MCRSWQHSECYFGKATVLNREERVPPNFRCIWCRSDGSSSSIARDKNFEINRPKSVVGLSGRDDVTSNNTDNENVDIESNVDASTLIHSGGNDPGEETLKEGDKVHVRYRGKGKWYAGQIDAMNDDGTYNVAYADDFKECKIPKELIRKRDQKPIKYLQEIFSKTLDVDAILLQLKMISQVANYSLKHANSPLTTPSEVREFAKHLVEKIQNSSANPLQCADLGAGDGGLTGALPDGSLAVEVGHNMPF